MSPQPTAAGCDPPAGVKTRVNDDGTVVDRVDRVDGVNAWARFSADRTRRYMLGRRWTNQPGSLLFVMLNPSIADALHDDQTIRRCMHFARREYYPAILVINLFSYRATDPGELLDVDEPCDAANAAVLADFARPPTPRTVLAWGAYDRRLGTAGAVLLEQYRAADVPLYHLGLTAAGHPRHPCRLGNDVPLIAYGDTR